MKNEKASYFEKTKITSAGLRLLHKLIVMGEPLVITKAVIGDGISEQDPVTFTELVHEIPSRQTGQDGTSVIVDVQNYLPEDEQTIIARVRVQNGDTEFIWRELGLIAKAPDGGEILFAYTRDNTESAMTFPVFSGVPISATVDIAFFVHNSANVEMNVTLPAEVRLEEFNAHKNAAELDHPDKSVKQRHIADSAIGTVQLAKGAVNNVRIGNNAVDARTIKDGEIKKTKLDTELQSKIDIISKDYNDLVNKPNIKINPYSATGDVIDTHLTVGNRKAESKIGENSLSVGYDNVASGINSVVVGGVENEASGPLSHVSGGMENIAGAAYSSVIGGTSNTANGASSSIVGGRGNISSGTGSVVVGGEENEASGLLSNIIGGIGNVALDYQVKMGHYSQNGQKGTSSGTEGDAFIIGNGTGGYGGYSNAFRVAYNGNVYGLNAFNSTGADYAEMFEWIDGNINNEDRRGLFAYIENGKMRLATSEDKDKHRLGIIAATPAVVGDNYDDDWRGKYLTDVFGVILTQKVHYDAEYKTIECIDPQTGEPITCQICVREECDAAEPILNPDYDPDKTYIPRAERPEYDYWSFCGKLVVVDDGTCEPNGYCYPSENGVATSTENGFYVMERLDDTHIRILLK